MKVKLPIAISPLGSCENQASAVFRQRLTGLIRAKTHWVDSACAACPGFLVLGAADARLSSFVEEPQSV